MNKRFGPSFLLKTFIFCLVLLSGSSGVMAQSERSVDISLPDCSAYPEISFYIDPIDRDGSPLENLQMDQIALLEDGIQRDILDMQALQPGIQLVLAFNFSPPFAIQDIVGRSRFEYIQESLLNWADQPLDTADDDLSIIDNLGLEQIHLASRADLVNTLQEMGPVSKETASDFTVLARAIEIASDPIKQPGMKKVILFFTPQPLSEGFETIDSLISQAKDNQVLVYSILVSSPAYFETAGATKLQSLSQETGGSFLTFSGDEPLADLGQLFLPLRTTYLLKYQSSILSSGIHTLEVSIASTPNDIVGTREFNLDIEPPNPIFITPPRTITRTPLEESLEEDQEIRYEPSSLALPILIEFTDQHPRELEEVIFRVDGEIVESRTSPPFDEFIWDLEDYHNSGTHYLTLEAVDVMGLSRLSVETPIEIEVIHPPLEFWEIVRKNSPALLGLAVILLLGLTTFVLISRGRIHPGKNRLISRIKEFGNRVLRSIKDLGQTQKGSTTQSEIREFSPYRLIPVNDTSQELFPEPIQIVQAVITLGNSNLKEGIRVQHPSITPKHARIKSQKGKKFQITDLGSVAGTWINYKQIPPSSPHVLKDGDIINIGEAAFRFQIKNGPDSPAANKEKEL